MPSSFPFPHSCHDYSHLCERWYALAADVGGKWSTLVETDGYPIHAFETGSGATTTYLSAGVHGDECAPPWALLHWAEANRSALAKSDFLILPCLNPHGLVENRRVDGSDIDLNRAFQDSAVPVISAWQKLIKNRRFERCLNLHEDYDARGIYLYEIGKAAGAGRAILETCGEIIPSDPNAKIDGQQFENGLCFHKIEDLRRLVDSHLEGGYPEAIYLGLHHTQMSVTFESPSEMDIAVRVATQIRAIETFVALPKK